MHTFTDLRGKIWDVSLTLGIARRIDASDFTAITDKEIAFLKPGREFFLQVISDASLLASIIWVVVQPQVKENLGIDPAEKPDEAEQAFVYSWNGTTITEARTAFWKALADFSPDHKTILDVMIPRMETAQKKIALKIMETEDMMDLIVDQEIDKQFKNLKTEIENELGEKSGASSESSDSSLVKSGA